MATEGGGGGGRAAFKTVLVGEPMSGKSSLLRCVKYGAEGFDMRYRPDTGVDFGSVRFQLPHNNDITLQLWDIGGGAPIATLISTYIANCQAVLVTYDTTSEASFVGVLKWLDAVKAAGGGGGGGAAAARPYAALVACQADRRAGEGGVSDADHARMARRLGMTAFSTSARSGDGVHAALAQIAADLAGVPLTNEQLCRLAGPSAELLWDDGSDSFAAAVDGGVLRARACGADTGVGAPSGCGGDCNSAVAGGLRYRLLPPSRGSGGDAGGAGLAEQRPLSHSSQRVRLHFLDNAPPNSAAYHGALLPTGPTSPGGVRRGSSGLLRSPSLKPAPLGGHAIVGGSEAGGGVGGSGPLPLRGLSSAAGILPVVAVGDTPLGAGGPWTAQSTPAGATAGGAVDPTAAQPTVDSTSHAAASPETCRAPVLQIASKASAVHGPAVGGPSPLATPTPRGLLWRSCFCTA